MTSGPKHCRSCGESFAASSDDLSFYGKIDIPSPSLCPLCRQQRRSVFRNFKTLYKRPSAKSGGSIVSMYAPESPYIVYSHDEWWSDNFDPFAYGREFDFNRPFFEQFQELLRAVPRFALRQTNCESCEYSNFAFGSKNCYLVFGCVDDEDCAYGHITWNSKSCLDTLYCYKSEGCYECTDVLGSYNLSWSTECEDCARSVGLYDCRGCTDCIGCVGLRQKSYHLWNEPVGKEGIEKFLKEHPLHDPSTIKLILEKREELRRTLPHQSFYGSHNASVSGNHIYNAKNVHYSFDVKGGEDASYIFTGRNIIDCRDVSFTIELEASYEVLTGNKTNRAYFCHLPSTSSDIYYSDYCSATRNAFGCAGLKSGEYVVFNKKYSKESFEDLKRKITEHMQKTGEWGEFFPVALSPFGYNESIAHEYTPLLKEEALSKGFRWQDNLPLMAGKETISHDELPKNPKEFSERLAEEILKCGTCERNYRLIPYEIEFYRSRGFSLPSECFNCRHARRMRERAPRALFDGACARCGKAIRTSYPSERQKEYKLYCESCYQQEMF